MDLEKLTKHQIVLLTLLVSFVTSIATGIVTVSLMNQAPASVSQTINRIVERTVETVVPAELSANVAERTIVVKEDDLTAKSIASVQKALVRIVPKSNPDYLLARGIVVGRSVGLTDRGALLQYGGPYEAILASGERVPISVVAGTSSIAVIAIGSTTMATVPVADVGKLQLGQSVIRIGGGGADTVGVGVVARLPDPAQGSNLVEATVSSATPGSVLVTIFGEVIGLVTSQSLAASSEFYSVIDTTLLGL